MEKFMYSDEQIELALVDRDALEVKRALDLMFFVNCNITKEQYDSFLESELNIMEDGHKVAGAK